jgi:dTMP kinase
MIQIQPGKFVTFEGPECSGKTSTLPLLADHLRMRGYTVVETREPGGTPFAEVLRNLVLSPAVKVSPMTELLVFFAARFDHVEKVVKPALALGHVVLCSRFTDTTYAYQGAGRGLIDEVLQLEKLVLGDFQPDVTLFFDIPLEESRRRLGLRDEPSDRIEQEKDDFHRATFEGYRRRFLDHPARMQRIDALPEYPEVLKQVLAWANATFDNIT